MSQINLARRRRVGSSRTDVPEAALTALHRSHADKPVQPGVDCIELRRRPDARSAQRSHQPATMVGLAPFDEPFGKVGTGA
jgi:hypothetical protein